MDKKGETRAYWTQRKGKCPWDMLYHTNVSLIHVLLQCLHFTDGSTGCEPPRKYISSYGNQ